MSVLITKIPILVPIIIPGTALKYFTKIVCAYALSSQKMYLHYGIIKLTSLLVTILYLMTLVDKTSSGNWRFSIRDTDLYQCPR